MVIVEKSHLSMYRIATKSLNCLEHREIYLLCSECIKDSNGFGLLFTEKSEMYR